MKTHKYLGAFFIIVFLLFTLADCSTTRAPASNETLSVSPQPDTTATLPVATQTATPTASPSPTSSPTPYPYFEPAGCLAPVEDYSLVEVEGWYLNQRTLIMLKHASELFNGNPQYLLSLITQGSYHDNGAASWGTHLGGGAVDLSVMLPGTYTIAASELSRMVRSLRAAGFAAWYRDADELFSGSAMHIHAIAVGDAELSEPAQAQLTSREGYFFGFNGIPVDFSEPIIDRHGGPVVCSWMINSGYPAYDVQLDGRMTWKQRLLQAAGSLLTNSGQDTRQLADNLSFYPGTLQGMQELEGPLVMQLLHESGLVLDEDAPYFQLPRFRLSNLDDEWRFWAQFPDGVFTRYEHASLVGAFDFSAWPLLPGDVVISSMNGVYYHLFMVSEGGEGAVAYSVVPVEQPDGTFLIQRMLLYDPARPGEGLLKTAWSGCSTAECTGAGSFLVLRRQDLHLPPGSLVTRIIMPGDSLPLLALQYDTTLEEIITANPRLAVDMLNVGEEILIPVNTLAGNS